MQRELTRIVVCIAGVSDITARMAVEHLMPQLRSLRTLLTLAVDTLGCPETLSRPEGDLPLLSYAFCYLSTGSHTSLHLSSNREGPTYLPYEADHPIRRVQRP